MASLKEKSSSLSLNCSSAVGGGSSLLRNKKKKKKFEYNNGKYLHGFEAVVLKSGTQWNPDRLFLRCPLWEVGFEISFLLVTGVIRLFPSSPSLDCCA